MTARVLITGVGGFVGRHLTHGLTEAGDVVLGAGVGPRPPAIERALAGYWPVDVRDGAGLEAALAEAKPTAIVHLAAQSSGALAFERPLETYATNALGTFTLLEAVHRAAPAARVLVVGTGDAYGPQAEGSRVAEEEPLRPVSPYALSKASADVIAETCARLWNLDVVRARSFGHIGPGQSELFVVPSWARQLAEIEAGRREHFVRVGNLDVTRDLTDVRDVVEAYGRLLRLGRSGAAYNVCRGVGASLGDVARSLCDRAAVPVRIEVDPARVRPQDIPWLVGDPTRLERDTGWSPAIPLDRSLDDVMAEWRRRVAEGKASR